MSLIDAALFSVFLVFVSKYAEAGEGLDYIVGLGRLIHRLWIIKLIIGSRV